MQKLIRLAAAAFRNLLLNPTSLVAAVQTRQQSRLHIPDWQPSARFDDFHIGPCEWDNEADDVVVAITDSESDVP